MTLHSVGRRTNPMIILIVLALLLAACHRETGVVGSISGILVDASTRQPIAGALIRGEGAAFETITGPDGEFAIQNLNPQTYELYALISTCISQPSRKIKVRPGLDTKAVLEVDDFRVDSSIFGHGIPPRRPQVWYSVFRAGQKAARLDAASGKARTMTYGLHSDGLGFDTATGLVYNFIADCIVDDSITGLADGYNSFIAAWLVANGQPSYSLKRWTSQLLDLRGSFTRCSTLVRPAILERNGDHTFSTDRRVRLSLEVAPSRMEGSSPVRVVIQSGDSAMFADLVYEGGHRSWEVAWGPDSSGLVFLRDVAEGYLSDAHPVQHYAAVSVRTGATLSSEFYTRERGDLWKPLRIQRR